MRKPDPVAGLARLLLLSSLLPWSDEVPMLTPAAARAAVTTEPAEEAVGCDAIRARISQGTRQLRRAIANGNTPLARRLRR